MPRLKSLEAAAVGALSGGLWFLGSCGFGVAYVGTLNFLFEQFGPFNAALIACGGMLAILLTVLGICRLLR